VKSDGKQSQNISLMGFCNSLVNCPSKIALLLILKDISDDDDYDDDDNDDDENKNLMAAREETFQYNTIRLIEIN
jgi:hypothetical protein